ncbi:MAG: glycoside hydrolase family 130 protein [Akkermansiaceae bacterium]
MPRTLNPPPPQAPSLGSASNEARALLFRSIHNPIITAAHLPFPGQCCFNSGAVRVGEEIIMVLNCWDAEWVPRFLVARSRDGIHFEIGRDTIAKPPQEYPYIGHSDGIFDTRITTLEGHHYITYNVSSSLGGRIRLLRTADFESFEDLGFITSVDHRNCVIFPGTFNGFYARLERPNGEGTTGGDIYLSYSPDLIFWGRTQLVLQKGTRYWESCKIGPGAPPIRTAAGWLVLYHGCRQHMNGIMYSAGAMLLDLEDPSKVIGKMRACLMWPETDYEFRGNVPQVVFPTAAVAGFRQDELLVYYGAADSSVCLATLSIQDLVDRCLADGPCLPGEE